MFPFLDISRRSVQFWLNPCTLVRWLTACILVQELLGVWHFGEVVLLKNLPGQVQVVDRPFARRIVHHDGLTVTRRFAQPGVSVDQGVKHHVPEVHAHFLDHLVGQA